MPEKDGSEDKKSTKSVVNKKQKQFMNQEEQLDLSSVAESFGGKIVGEPVELDEFVVSGTVGTAAALKYGIPAAIAIGSGLYDYYKKSKGEKGIFPSAQDYSNMAQYGKKKAKQVVSKIKNIFKSTTRTDQEDSSASGTSGGTEQQRKYRNKRRRNLDGPDYSDTSSRTGDLKSGRFKYNKNNNQNNKNKNFSKRDAAIGFGSGLGTSTAISTLTKGKKKGGGGFRLGGLPGTAHNVGRRTNPQ